MCKIIYKSLFSALVLLGGFFLSGCDLQEQAKIIAPSGHVIHIEVALTPEDQQRGLMGRPELAADAGMLFVFDAPRRLGFWMKDTLIPLDVVFIDSGKKIVDIQTMPPCPAEVELCPNYTAKEPALYALEINGGAAEKMGLKVGDQLQLVLPETK
jgi:uncharacterized membrane protein (UPF0127 family)